MKLYLQLLKGTKLFYIFALISIAISTALSFVTPLLLRAIIDSVIGTLPLSESFVVSLLFQVAGGLSNLRQHLWIATILLLLVTIIHGFFSFLTGKWTAMASESIAKSIRNRLYDHIQKLPFLYHSNTQTGDLIQRSTTDLQTIKNFLGTQIVEIGKTILMLIISLFIMLRINVKMTILSMISVPILIGFSYIFFKKIQTKFWKSDEADGKLSNVLQENLSGVRVVRAFARQQYEIERFDEANVLYRDETVSLIKTLAVYWSLTDFVAAAQIAIVLFVGISITANGEMSIGSLFLFSSMVGQLLWPIRQLGRILTEAGKASVSVSRINEILNTKQEKYEGDLKPKIEGKIEFSKVKFSYEEKPILEDINMTIEAGSTIAILGHTGCGKSTLVQLLPRLLDYQSGSIKIDGKELNKIDKNWVRKNISILLQEPFLYSRTIESNVRFGDKSATDFQVEEVCKTAAVHNDIINFEKSYQTIIGEKGVTLSGGQKQRISIARTLIRNSPIIIFDDSLSAVDTEIDMFIRRELKKRKGTTIIISHRLATIYEADKIFILEDGKIAQSGNHSELVTKKGLYKEIWEIQKDVFSK